MIHNEADFELNHSNLLTEIPSKKPHLFAQKQPIEMKQKTRKHEHI
jgi:hypothetical protein